MKRGKRGLAVGAFGLSVSFAFLAALAACGGSNGGGFFAPGSDGGSNGSGNNGTSSGGGNGGSSSSGGTPIITGGGSGGADGGTSSGCSAASQLVYVLSTDNDIYSFDPPSKTFTKVSTLGCNVDATTTPNSMAVDREGNAWVNYVTIDPILETTTGGSIYKVDIATGNCTPTNITLSGDWYQLGMGYSTASATDTTDTLYVAATNSTNSSCAGGGGGFGGGGGGGKKSQSAGLATIDTAAQTLTPIGPFTAPLAGQSAELTGTGDGRLFGFFVLDPIQLAQIDKATGATATPVTMTGVNCPVLAWAFSFWGGDFYLYTAPDTMTPSTVTHYSTGNGGIDTSYASATFTIVGAGVSTCAPTTQPPPK